MSGSTCCQSTPCQAKCIYFIILEQVLVLTCFTAANAKPNMAPANSIASFLNWNEHESHCGGQHQSPINIESNKAFLANYPEFIFHQYDRVFPEILENDGHSGNG